AGYVPVRGHEMEVEWHVELVEVLPVVRGPFRKVEDVYLPHGQSVTVIGVGDLPQPPVNFVNIGMAEVVEMDEGVVLPHVLVRPRVVVWRRGVVPLTWVFHHL